MASLSIEQVDPAATWHLRRMVLRPHQTVEQVAADSDKPGVFAIGALLERSLRACAVAMPEPFPDRPEQPDAWRIRGMAAHPEHRGQGLGTLVLDRLLAELRLRDAKLAWCHARVRAVPLYERAGFATIGEAWDDPEIGPHVRMWTLLA